MGKLNQGEILTGTYTPNTNLPLPVGAGRARRELFEQGGTGALEEGAGRGRDHSFPGRAWLLMAFLFQNTKVKCPSPMPSPLLHHMACSLAFVFSPISLFLLSLFSLSTSSSYFPPSFSILLFLFLSFLQWATFLLFPCFPKLSLQLLQTTHVYL